MRPPSGSTSLEKPPSGGRVHVIGAGPVGLLLTALLQSMPSRFSVRLYEKAARVHAHADGPARAVSRGGFGRGLPYGLHRWRKRRRHLRSAGARQEGLAFRQSIPPDLMGLLRRWTLGFCPLNDIERSLSDLMIDARAANGVQRTAAVVTAEDADGDAQPGDVADRLHRLQVATPRPSGPSGWGEVDERDTLMIRLSTRSSLCSFTGETIRLATSTGSTIRTSNNHAITKFIPTGQLDALRRRRQPRLGHRQHHRRGL